VRFTGWKALAEVLKRTTPGWVPSGSIMVLNTEKRFRLTMVQKKPAASRIRVRLLHDCGGCGDHVGVMPALAGATST
jgi:hypothetical protein